MKKNLSRLFFCALVLLAAAHPLCSGQTKVAQEPIDQYVVEVFEDSKGKLWFGTLSKGAACYDGKKLSYLSTKQGLIGNAVVSIVEDRKGNMWFGTQSGLSKYDGKTFTNFSRKEGLMNNQVSDVLIDKKGNVWVGTWGGVFRFNGSTFSSFPLPTPNLQLLSYQSTMNWVTEIMEDKRGNIWFCRDGYGACKFDGKSFTHFTKKDGLASNNVQAIQEDNQGNIWFGSRITEKDNPDPKSRTGDGGLSRYDGKKIIQYPAVEGLSKNETYAIHTGRSGKIWIGANRVGAYCYDGKKFTLYGETDRADLMPYGYGIQAILEDSKGRIWLGLSGGLFRLKDSKIAHMGENGPWE
ncbi:MAG: two-component regulator propeller domain-containing protein [Haliscomenobacter sp.]|uniref:ligand-binding sensor domain-containing protein n=1 Tax=Haliscomenobacter sp. TaxID=2717303 RepID=UPI0029BBECCF|nr:two-component regulator propeller domain-containing protein [Haliscomenobacter sp.]MDX2072108.1 two-component regulator propeller domain-containing protein [Haliscomenobacter sp.]